MSSLRSKIKSLLDIIDDPLTISIPLGVSMYEDGTSYSWSRADFDYHKSFVEKSVRVHLQHLYVDLKKIHSEGTYNTWMADTVTFAIKNIESLTQTLIGGIRGRYADGDPVLAAGLVDKAKINIEVPACVHESSWNSLVEVLDSVHQGLQHLIPE